MRWPDEPETGTRVKQDVEYAVAGKDRGRKVVPVMSFLAGRKLLEHDNTTHLKVVRRIRTEVITTITVYSEWEDTEDAG